MARKLFSVLVCGVLLFATLACQFFPGSNTAVTPTSTTVAAVSVTQVEPTATVDTAATEQAAQQAVEKAATQSAQATEEAQAQAKAEAATQTAAAKITEQAANRLARTATAVAQATAQAADMYSQVEKLKSEGILQSTAGSYHLLEDFQKEWAQLNWYQWWNTGYQPADFVLRTHTTWESASRTANWFAAGCGFVFRAKDENNHYMIFLALDNNVYMRGYVDGKYREFGKSYAGRLDHMKGEADIMLVVQGDRFVYYVNGQKVFDQRNSELSEGDLGLTLNSGTNKDFGTRCEMTHIELWTLDKP